MIQQTRESVSTTELRGYITSWNQGSESLFGYMANEVIGKHISLLYEKEAGKAFVKNISALIKNGEHHDILHLIKKDKESILVNLSFSFYETTKTSLSV